MEKYLKYKQKYINKIIGGADASLETLLREQIKQMTQGGTVNDLTDIDYITEIMHKVPTTQLYDELYVRRNQIIEASVRIQLPQGGVSTLDSIDEIDTLLRKTPMHCPLWQELHEQRRKIEEKNIRMTQIPNGVDALTHSEVKHLIENVVYVGGKLWWELRTREKQFEDEEFAKQQSSTL